MENSARIPIHDFLPHRKPMLMVDYILEISPKFVLCEFLIPKDCLFLAEGELQETGVIEHMAQTCSSIVGQNFYGEDYNPEQDERIIGFISAIKKIQLYSLPLVGQCIYTKADLMSQFEGEGYSTCTMQVLAQVNGIPIAEAEINLFLQGTK